MTKKKNTFASWQEANQVRRENIIDQYLKVLGKTRVKVRNPTALAELVASHISQAEGEPCNKATLLRNDRYKAKLLSYHAKSLVPGSKALNPRAVTDPTAKALVTSSHLETSNLKRELERLNIYVTSLEQQIDAAQSKRPLLPAPAADPGDSAQVSDFEFRFIRTCQALRSLLDHLNLVVQVDTKAKCILDASKRRNNVIVDQVLAGPFFDWLAGVGGGPK
ncbi:MAG: hypothetical protein E6Q40_06365 [Cupriavidus sp.]|nr:MAG: hypothetical protein E6Q40_06365 [Cupriavidus sp.]